jgi:hypothetical protein
MKEPTSSDPFTEPIIIPEPEYDPDPPVVVVERPVQQVHSDVCVPNLAGLAGSEDGLEKLWAREIQRILCAPKGGKRPAPLPEDFCEKRGFLTLARLAFSDYDVALRSGDAKHAIWAVARRCDYTVKLWTTRRDALTAAQWPCSAGKRCSLRRHQVLPVTRWPKSRP